MALRREPRKVEHTTIGFKVWRGFPGTMLASHMHGELEWNFLLTGTTRYFLAGRFCEIPAGRLAVFWAGMPHVMSTSQKPCELIWVTLPLAWFMQWGLPEEFTQRLLRGELLLEPDRSLEPLDRLLLARWVEDMKSGQPEAKRVVLLEVEARLRRMALGSDKHDAARHATGEGSSPIEKVTEYIGNHYREELSVVLLSKLAGLHPNYLMQLFKRRCGMGLWEYILQLRTSHAQRLLLMTDAKVLDVALDSGFGSASRFYETFTRLCGQTPRQYRLTMGQSGGKTVRASKPA
jgi:AraC family transcriptional regulator, melibiose operon regulatory protein